MSAARALWLGLAVLYPLLVFAGLTTGWWGPRHMGLLLLLMAVIRLVLRSKNSSVDLWLIAPPFLLALPALLFNQEIWVLIYPALVSGLLLVIFSISLYRPPTVIESIARLQDADLSAAGVQYTRKVTQAWCVFFFCNGSIALLTAFFATYELWALYNGLIAYVLIGVMFAGESLVRKKALAIKAH